MIYVMDTPLITDVRTVLKDVKAVLVENGSELLGKIKESGNSIQISCPFHGEGKERHPSCGVLAKTKKNDFGDIIPAGTFHCFTCGKSGTLNELISYLFDKNDAGFYGYKWLVSHYCSVETKNRQPIELSFSAEVDPEEPIISEEELAKYRFYHPYMWQRKLTEKVVNYFDVGYDKETNCLTFPVKDLFGDVRYIQRRSVKGKFFSFGDDTNKGRYIYGLYEASMNPDRKVVISEAPIDALTAWIHGYAGIATCGLPVTPQQIDILKYYSAREYIIASDDDFAGNLAAQFLNKRINKILWRMTFNGKKDLNEMTEEDWAKITFNLFL